MCVSLCFGGADTTPKLNTRGCSSLSGRQQWELIRFDFDQSGFKCDTRSSRQLRLWKWGPAAHLLYHETILPVPHRQQCREGWGQCDTPAHGRATDRRRPCRPALFSRGALLLFRSFSQQMCVQAENHGSHATTPSASSRQRNRRCPLYSTRPGVSAP